MILGIDPTKSTAWGWAVVTDGKLHACGEQKIAKGAKGAKGDVLAAVDQQVRGVGALLVQYRPQCIAIERPAINTVLIAEYMARAETGDERRIAGAVNPAIDLGIVIGALVQLARDRSCRPIILNVGAAKAAATGSILSGKSEMRAAARIYIAEWRNCTISEVALPGEHLADAIFIARAGEIQQQRDSWYAHS